MTLNANIGGFMDFKLRESLYHSRGGARHTLRYG